MIFDPLWLLFMIPGILLGLWAQTRLSSTYRRHLEIGTSTGLTGAQAARELLDRAGLQNVPVEMVGGHLTDHYDPSQKALRLSQENFYGRSISAVGVAAHEAGHALQHQAAYAPLKLRMMMVPITQFASYAWSGVILLGFLVGISKFIWVGVGIFAIITAFQLITLPVEYDASRRAKDQLLKFGLIHPGESGAVSKVLNAAALTYVAAMISALMQLLYFVLLARNRE